MLTLTSLTIWLRWEEAGSSGMLTLTSLTIWLHWKQPGSGGSGFAGSSGSGLIESMLVRVDVASLVAENLDLL